MLWLEVKYLSLVSFRLDLFKKTGDSTYNFRCPFCGDSKRSRFKARGYLYLNKGSFWYRCHNCGDSRGFTSFLKEVDFQTYRDYRLELLKENGRSIQAGVARPVEVSIVQPENPKIDPLKSLKTIAQFSPEHPVRSYVTSRAIPEERMSKLYYVTRFMEWINTVLPGKFDERQLRMDEPRLVIPFLDEDGGVFAVTGRSFKRESTVKYLTVKFDESKAKIFGMDEVDPSRRVYIVEGPIDSFFIDNSVAFAGSSGALPDFPDSVIVLDNEPRNREIVRLVERFIDAGKNVCIWPGSMNEKDINDLVVSGRTADEIKSTIDENTYHGLAAKLKLAEWRAVR